VTAEKDWLGKYCGSPSVPLLRYSSGSFPWLALSPAFACQTIGDAADDNQTRLNEG